ncbi:TetR/AcrR family transcriptional regulator [Salinicoccus sp. ID82-1]|uniref:TetR/AcrR family transcriptional regulator n=1 Tax=Salinicoccus sp. ID82-1 TaxID=2820269 RepID=UPI001F48CD58|nr:TetR/AcrR family transcriptional regulator [Salinicoccus sp. ID82-1]MCG1010015.1 TetR/AcrR family transcriptional regulator [Salinicoccus sp. ID82-1]
MKKPFKKLDDSQQYHILTTAMAEFSAHGYKRASTNRIVNAAGISKGLLYYYFENKETLYLSTAEFAYDHFTTHLLSRFTTEAEGFIERLARLSRIKHVYFTQHPEIAQFVTHMYYAEGLLSTYQSKMQTLRESSLHAMYENVDMTLFRTDIDREMAMKMIGWTFEGYVKEMEQYFEAQGIDFDQVDTYFAQFGGYLDTMRKLYYKEV